MGKRLVPRQQHLWRNQSGPTDRTGPLWPVDSSSTCWALFSICSIYYGVLLSLEDSNSWIVSSSAFDLDTPHSKGFYYFIAINLERECCLESGFAGHQQQRQKGFLFQKIRKQRLLEIRKENMRARTQNIIMDNPFQSFTKLRLGNLKSSFQGAKSRKAKI